MIYRLTVSATADLRERWTVDVPDDLEGDALHNAAWHQLAGGSATFEDQDVSGERDREILSLEPVAPALAPLEAELREARELGKNAAPAAATWTVDGNTPEEAIRAALRGLEEGDPAVLDSFKAPNLSGEWAEGRTPASLARELGLEPDELEPEALEKLSDAYEAGVGEAFLPAVEAELRRWIGEEASP